MKSFKYALDFSFIKDEASRPKETKTIFEQMLIGAIHSRYKDGLNMEFQRRFFKIVDKLEKTETEYLELEDAEFEFIKDIFTNAKFSPQNVKSLVQIYDAIEEASAPKKG